MLRTWSKLADLSKALLLATDLSRALLLATDLSRALLLATHRAVCLGLCAGGEPVQTPSLLRCSGLGFKG